jgi:cytochrome P450
MTNDVGYSTIEGDFDPFATKDAVFGHGTMADPYPRLTELLAQCPAHEGAISEKFDMIGPDTMIFGHTRQVSVFSFDLVEEVYKDTSRFSSAWFQPSLGDVIGRTILEMDPPEHGRFRQLIQGAFTKKEMDRWERDFVRDIVDGYIDRFVDSGRAELVHDFAFHYPLHVITRAAGLPETDVHEFYRRAALITNVAVSQEMRVKASSELGAYVSRVIDDRRGSGGTDLISMLLRNEYKDEDGARHHLTDDEIVAFMRLLIPAGAQTTYRSLCNILYGLLTHPDQLEALQGDLTLIPQAIEEGLRWEVPLTQSGRLASTDTTIGGMEVSAGCPVNMSIGAANHDPTRWEHPEEFDIFRAPQAHLGFGTGPHVCLGIHFARMELRVALEQLLTRLPRLRLDPDAPESPITGLGMRSPAALPVVFG